MAATISTTTSYVEVLTTAPVLETGPISLFDGELCLRSFNLDDLEAYHSYRMQSESRICFGEAENIHWNQDQNKLQTTNGIHLGIFLNNSDSEGEFIGEGQIRVFFASWPHIGWKFKPEFRNQGYDIELAQALHEFWLSLPRKVTQRRLDHLLEDFVPLP